MQKIAIGIDCGTTLTASLAKKFHEGDPAHNIAPASFAGRYIRPSSWKTMHKAEADLIRAAGLALLLVYERSKDSVKGGADSGKADGAEAFKYVESLGVPQNAVVALYFAVDYEALASDYNTIEAYLRAAKKEIPGFKIGVYGSYGVVEEMHKRGVADYFWQTLAWSHGKISAHANVYQRQIDVSVNGIGIDWNDQFSEAGLWGLATHAPKPVTPPAPPISTPEGDEDMDKVLGYEEWAWQELETWVAQATADGTLKDAAWATKAKARKLTYKDLLLLKVLIDERRRTKK